uniref:Uncharacterized protein n=1 Tax=Gopherus evgoodei TaxID=1825980 RepID=A0A8C4WDK0_9SAUR
VGNAFLSFSLILGSGSCGKVLVWPADYSHWLNVKSILEELADRGHEVTVLLSSSFLGIDPTRPSPFNFEVIPMPFTKEDMASLLEDFLHMWLYELPNFSYWETTSRLCNLISRMRSVNKATCDSVVWNEELMKMLREATFDILLADPLVLGGELVAEKLGIPFVYTIRFSIGSTVERLCGELPAPPSYVPASMGSLTDRMSFMERMKNMFFYALQDVLFHQVFWREWSQYYSDVLGKASHWLNMKLVLEELSLRGHDVTVLVPSANLFIDYNESSSPFDFEVLPVPFTKETMAAMLEDFLHLWMYELPHLSYWEGLVKVMENMEVFVTMSKQICDSVVLNPRLTAKLQQAGFDMLIADPLSLGGELIAELLEIPFVYTFRFSEGNTAERLCGGLPAPPSYVPASTGGLTDRMSFMERWQNLLFYALQDVLFHQVFWREWSQYYSDVLGKAALVCRDCVYTVTSKMEGPEPVRGLCPEQSHVEGWSRSCRVTHSIPLRLTYQRS